VTLTPLLIVFIQVLRSTAANGALRDVVQGLGFFSFKKS